MRHGQWRRRDSISCDQCPQSLSGPDALGRWPREPHTPGSHAGLDEGVNKRGRHEKGAEYRDDLAGEDGAADAEAGAAGVALAGGADEVVGPYRGERVAADAAEDFARQQVARPAAVPEADLPRRGGGPRGARVVDESVLDSVPQRLQDDPQMLHRNPDVVNRIAVVADTAVGIRMHLFRRRFPGMRPSWSGLRRIPSAWFARPRMVSGLSPKFPPIKTRVLEVR